MALDLEDLSFEFLKEITNDFSNKRKVGEGTFGVVYRGVTKNGEDVAVKEIKLVVDPGCKQFQNEFNKLRKLKHQNIVQVLGYCYETKKERFTMPDGTEVLCDNTYAALCFEYLHNGSLQKHLSDELCEPKLNWHTRFKIIRGICEGLKYIHKDLEEPIYHLDLKPDNILLDKDMVPKIADFGLSRIFGKERIRNTTNPYGTPGYQPREYVDEGKISDKFDIFSLGVVMIQILSGSEGHSKCCSMSSDEFVDQVQKFWTSRLQATCSSDSSLKEYCHQVETCTKIALNCMEDNRQERPDIVQITEKLNAIDADIGKLLQKGCHGTISELITHSNEMEIRTESKNITDQQQNIHLMPGPSYSGLDFFDVRETTSDAAEEVFVGREDEGRIIRDLLKRNLEKIVILPIHGIGGIGKTTFARYIYNDPNFNNYSHVWIDVTQRLDLDKIYKSVISQLSEKEIQDNKKQMIPSCPAKLHSGRKIMIVLDDLWEDDQFQLQELKDMVYHDASKIIILVTTRSKRVAERICTNIQPYEILPLTNDMCWEIIKQKSDFEARDNKEQFIDIGREIARKCSGVALAARSLGFTLRSMSFNQWEKVKESDIWNESVSKDASYPNHVLASLMLSYIYMDLCMKPCFTYCAIFPKGHKIAKNDLIYQWISLDLIKPKRLLSDMQLCEKYILQLLGLSFFQHSVSPKTSGANHDEMFTMHDLVHDLARSIMGDKILDASKTVHTGESYCNYALLDDCSMPLKSFMNSPDSLRALRFVQCAHFKLCCSAFSPAKSLRVLDLSECCIQKLPDSIRQLKQLRYLNAPGIQDQTILNCITGLSKLIYLSIPGSSAISDLPVLFGEMEDLMYLDLSGCSKIQKLPKSFGNLKKLLHLDLSDCGRIEGVSKHLGNLRELQSLNLSGCQQLEYEWPRSFRNLQNLVYLDVSCCSNHYELPMELGGLTKLKYLNMHDCYISDGGLRHLKNLTELRYLNLSGCGLFNDRATQRLFKHISALSNLEHLDLSYNEYLDSLPGCLGNLQKLQTLDISGCSSLKKLPKSIENIRHLKFLIANGCHELQYREQPQSSTSFAWLPTFTVHLSEDQSSSNLVRLQDLNVTTTELEICCLENVMSTQEARAVQLVNKQTIEYLLLEWTLGAKRFVGDMELLTELLPPVTLEKFIVQCYCGVRFPEWMMIDISDYFPNLVEIELDDLPECNMLPPLGKLPNLKILHIRGMKNLKKIDERFYGSTKAFPKLQHLSLLSMQSLEEWDTMCSHGDGVEKLVFPSLESLEVLYCPQMRLTSCPPIAERWHIVESDNVLLSGREGEQTCPSISAAVRNQNVHVQCSKVPLHQWRLLHYLPAIRSLKIIRGSRLTRSTPVIMQNLSCLQSLCLKADDQRVRSVVIGGRIAEMPPQIIRVGQRICVIRGTLPKWLGELRSLKELEISGYEDIDAPVEIMKQLSSLESLTIHHCARMTMLPQWLGELTSLQELVITVMPQLKTLHDSMQHLKSLKSLEVWHCQNIPVLPEWLGNLSALQKVKINDCSGIKSLPESIQRLTRLKELHTSGCPGLDRWSGLDEIKKKLPDIKAYSDSKFKTLLKIEPTEIRLPFQVKRLVSCSLRLTNNTKNDIAYVLRPTSPYKHFAQPNKGTVSPGSVCNLTVSMLAQESAPPDMQCDDKFIVQIIGDIFDKNRGDEVVDEAYLMVTYVAVEPSDPPTSLNDKSMEGSLSISSAESQECQSGKKEHSEKLSGDKIVQEEATSEVNTSPSLSAIIEVPTSSSQGAMGSLIRKLVLLVAPECPLQRSLKDVIELVKKDLESVDPFTVTYHNAEAEYWMDEVRGLTNYIEHFIDNLMDNLILSCTPADANGSPVHGVHLVPRTRPALPRQARNWRQGCVLFRCRLASWLAIFNICLSKRVSKLRVTKHVHICRSPRLLKPTTRIARLTKLRNLLREAIERHQRHLPDGSTSNPRFILTGGSRVPEVAELADNLVGIDEPRDKLMMWLTDEVEQQLEVIRIVGPAGIGKTALVKEVYHKLGGRFDCQAFIRVPRKPDMSSLLGEILYQVKGSKPNSNARTVNSIIDNIWEHLQDKRYLIVIDNLWEVATWDIIKFAFPEEKNCSRIIIVAEIDHVLAASCCGHQYVNKLELKPLESEDSQTLFLERAFGSENQHPRDLKNVSSKVIRYCGGLPLAILIIAGLFASEPNKPDMWDHLLQCFLYRLTSLTLEEMLTQIVNLCYNALPQHLKTCLLYLTMYPEGFTIRKVDLLNQWMAEGFISATEGKEAVAENYFDELINRGMIQPEEINHDDHEVLSCTLHHTVLDLISYKSRQHKFITSVDYSQRIPKFSLRAHRLSFNFSCAQYATKPEGIRLSHVRSLGFFGILRCMPSMSEFKLLRVLILEFCAGCNGCTSLNLSSICRLFHLRYLKISGHVTVELPSQIHSLQLLETIEIDARVSSVPNDIVRLPGLLHLRLQDDIKLPNTIGRITSLQTLEHFNIRKNSEDNVRSLGELINLNHLHLTSCAEMSDEHMKRKLMALASSLGRLGNLKSLKLVSRATGKTILVDPSSSMYNLMFLERLEMLPPFCIFSRLPQWIGKLNNLRILKIMVRVLLKNDIEFLEGLPTLTVLSLHVRRPAVECLVFNSGAFPTLKYLEYSCGALSLAFQKGAFPELQKLKLSFNVHGEELYSNMLVGVDNLLKLKDITVTIGAVAGAKESDRRAAESALDDEIKKHPKYPTFLNFRNVRRVDCIEEEEST